MTETIGIRELRQHASRYVAAARDGIEHVITDHGTPVARLVPLSPYEKELDRLVRKHGAIPPSNPHGSILDIVPLPPDGQDAQAILQAMREERFS